MENNENLNRKKIRNLLIIGIIGSVITGIGDFILGFAAEEEMPNIAAMIMASAPNLADWQAIAGGLLGFFGIFFEGIGYFAIYHLMADSSKRYSKIFKAGILGYIWLAPVGCHLNMGVMNMAYKYLLLADKDIAYNAAKPLIYSFSLPLYILLILFWVPMIIVQFKAFNKNMTPYPKYAKWFNILTGGIPTLLIGVLIGQSTAFGAAVGTTFLSVGNLLVFLGLLITLPKEEKFEEFRKNLKQS